MPVSQHPATYTIGKRGTAADFKSSEEELLHIGADIENINRGGETTFHGPGQVRQERRFCINTGLVPTGLKFPCHLL